MHSTTTAGDFPPTASPIVAVGVLVAVVAGQSNRVVAVPTVPTPLPPVVMPAPVDPNASPRVGGHSTLAPVLPSFGASPD